MRGRRPDAPLRVALSGDPHASAARTAMLREAFAGVDTEADLLLFAGDLTEHGTPEEARALLEALDRCRCPKAAVLGNHDHEHGQAEALVSQLTKGGVRVLAGETWVVDKRLSIAGTKGFCGGFGETHLAPWGERAIKRFVEESEHEAHRLELALMRARGSAARIALLHYSPIRATLEGEPRELYPFLGSSRLEVPIDTYGATLVVHGHAHAGTLEGRTAGGIPVYNAAMRLLLERTGKAYRVVELRP